METVFKVVGFITLVGIVLVGAATIACLLLFGPWGLLAVPVATVLFGVIGVSIGIGYMAGLAAPVPEEPPDTEGTQYIYIKPKGAPWDSQS